MSNYWLALIVSLSGACGAAARYAVGLWFVSRGQQTHYSTLTVNIIGTFILCLLVGAAWREQQALSFTAVSVGMLGGFTTYSTLSVQLVYMLKERRFRQAVNYMAYTFAGGFAAAAAGFYFGKYLFHL